MNEYMKRFLARHPNYFSEHRKNNRNKYRKARKKWYAKNKEKYKILKEKYEKTHPWTKTLCNLRARCLNKNDSKYKYYGGKGIKALLTIQEIETLWKRDKASFMKQPSIDRIDTKGNYDFSNCRFIEMSENRGRST